MNQQYIDYLKKYLPKEKLKEGIEQINKGISPQYIVGNVDFYGNLFKVNSNVLIPRFETELLVEKTINYIKKYFSSYQDLSILDIGTGSGCIAITLKKELDCIVTACDISKNALLVARENALFHHVDINFICSDIFSKIDDEFDIIISNPPYIRIDEEIEDIVRNNEPSIALYACEDGLFFYRKILADASKFLKKKFIIAFEIGELQGESVKNLAYQYLDDILVMIEKDYSNRDRFVFIISKKDC